MSVQPSIIICSVCDFKASSSCIYGDFKYLLPNGEELAVDRSLGWCMSCKNIKPIEELPDINKIREEITAVKSELNKLKHSFLMKLIPSTRNKIANLEANLQQLERKRIFLELRQSPSRCLVCASDDVMKINFPSLEKGEVINTGCDHPGCKGSLLIRKSEIRFGYFPLSHTYDVEGYLIREQEPSNR